MAVEKPKSAEEFEALSWDQVAELADAVSAGSILLTEEDYKQHWSKGFQETNLFGDTTAKAMVVADRFYDVANAVNVKCGLVFMVDITLQQPRTWDGAAKDHTNYATSELNLTQFPIMLKQLPEEISKHIVEVSIYANAWDPDSSKISGGYINTKLFLPSYSELGGSNWGIIGELGEKWPYFKYADDPDAARKKQYCQPDGALAETNYFTRSRFPDGDLYQTVSGDTGEFSTYGPIEWGGRLPLCFCMGSAEPDIDNAVTARQTVQLINHGLALVSGGGSNVEFATDEDITAAIATLIWGE